MGEALLVLAALLMIFVFVYPTAWILVASFRTPETMFAADRWIFTFDNYVGLFRAGFGLNILNSLVVCLASVVVSTLVAVAAAYVFSRMLFPGKRLLFASVLMGQTFPWIVLVTPLFILFARIGLLNSLGGMIFVYVAVTVPFSVYFLVGFLEAVPRSLDEAALIDGASGLQIVFRIIFPILTPGIVATATHAFMVCWSEYLFALAFLTATDVKTMPLALHVFFGDNVIEWQNVMTAAVLTTLPTVLLFIPLQRQLVSGLTAGSGK
jgi:ABC-type glycerol-3-phosphate transport system permease component